MIRARRCAFAVLLLLVTIAATSQQKLPNTLLWRISGNGLQKPSYLYGTMHLQDKRLFQFGDSVYHAIEQTDGLAIEIDFKEAMDSIFRNGLQSAEEEHHLKTSRVKINRSRLSKSGDSLLRSYGIKGNSATKQELKKIRDHRMSRLLSQGEMPTIVDAYLLGLAMRQSKWTGGIEDVADQLNLSDELGGALEPENVLVGESLFKSSIEGMVALYLKQDIEAMETMSTQGSSDADNAAMLTNRNLKMAWRMDSLSHQRTMFFAVGAAHLAGDSGVIRLLRLKGYTVEPVFSKNTLAADVYASQLQAVKWTAVQGDEDAYAVSMPGKPSDYNMFSDLVKMKMFFDITTMTFYITGSVTGPKAEAALLDTMAHNMLRNMTGTTKAANIKNLTAHGLVGREITGENNDATYRIRLYLKDKTVFILMAGGLKKVSVVSADAERFFASFTPGVTTRISADVTAFSIPDKGLSVLAPGTFKRNLKIDNGVDTTAGWAFTTYDMADARRGVYYMLQVREVSRGSYIDGDSAFFNELKNNYESNNLTVTAAIPAMVGGYPAMYINASYDEVIYKTLHVVRGNRVYSLLGGASAGSDISFVDSYLQSLTLLPYPVTPAIKTGLHGVSTMAPSPLLVIEDDSADRVEGRIHLQSYNAAEAITYDVFIDPFSPYYWIKDDSTYFANNVNLYVGYTDSLVKKEVVYNGNTKGIDLLVKEPDNNNLKKVRLLVNGDTLYTLISFMPAQVIADEEHQRFFTGFRVDAEAPPGIYTTKAPQLLMALQATDSATRTNANEMLTTVSFETGDLPLLHKALLQHYTNAPEDYSTNSSLVDVILPLADSSTLQFINANYSTLTGDKEALKYDLLEILASVKTEASYHLFKKLILSHPPQSGDALRLTQALTDSAALTKILFPEILMLAGDSLFAPPLAAAVNWLLDSNELSITTILPYKTGFTSGAAKALQRLRVEGDDYQWQATRWINLLGWLNDKEGNALLRKFLAYKSVYVKYDAILALLKAGQPVPPLEIAKVAADRSERIGFYEAMQKMGKLKLLPPQYTTQKSIAESELYSFLSDDYDVGPIAFIGERIAEYEGKKKKFYLFKVRINYDDETPPEYYLAVTGPYSLTSKAVLTYTEASGLLEEELFNAAKIDKLFKQYISRFTGED